MKGLGRMRTMNRRLSRTAAFTLGCLGMLLGGAVNAATVTKASIVGGEGGGEPGEDDVPDGRLSKFDAAFVYDGTGHTIDTNALVVAFGAAMIGENTVECAADDGSAGIGGRGAPALPWGQDRRI